MGRQGDAINLFVVQSLGKSGAFGEVVVGVLPFLLMMITFVALVTMFPSVAMWLPHVLAK